MNKGIIVAAITTLFVLISINANAHNKMTFGANISGAEQVVNTDVAGTSIPIVGLVSGAIGNAKFSLSKDKSTLSYKLKISPLPASPIVMAHIHIGPPGQNGNVMLWLFVNQTSCSATGAAGFCATVPYDNGEFSGEISGSLVADDLKFTGLGIRDFDGAIANIMAGNAYVNVHTEDHLGGEIRGQIMSGFPHKKH